MQVVIHERVKERFDGRLKEYLTDWGYRVVPGTFEVKSYTEIVYGSMGEMKETRNSFFIVLEDK